MPYRVVKGDLLNAQTEYIVQQNNCTVCQKTLGLSQLIANKWPEINPYKERRRYKNTWAIAEDRATPGTIDLYAFEEPINGLKAVICAFGQYTQGKPGTLNDPLGLSVKFKDSAADRVRYFAQCLESIAELNPKSVGFPYKIGCGLAGGSWQVYEKMLKQWAEAYPNIDVVVYQLE